MRHVLPWLLPTTKITTAAQGGAILALALSGALETVPLSTQYPPSDPFPDPSHTSAWVRFTCIVREYGISGTKGEDLARLAAADARANDPRLGEEWWPRL